MENRLGVYDHLREYENLDVLNHLACLLSGLDPSELETLGVSTVAAVDRFHKLADELRTTEAALPKQRS